MRTSFVLLLFGLFLPVLAGAHSYQQGAVRIGHLRAAPARASDRLAIEGPLFNTGTAPDRLMGATSAWAETVAIVDGSDTSLPGIELLPGQPVSLRPSGLHLILMDLHRDAPAGAMVPLVLTFAQAGVARVAVSIEPTP